MYFEDYFLTRMAAMEQAITNHPADGLVYEDEYVTVVRADSRIWMKGKPFKFPIMFSGVQDSD